MSKHGNAAHCIECDHEFAAAELAAMTAQDDRDDLCTITCQSCGALNEVRSEPAQGFDAQPELVVRRVLPRAPPHAIVFDETVEPAEPEAEL